MESICTLRLCDRAGNTVARALVDPDVWFEYARYRWHLTKGGYASTCFSSGPYDAYRPAQSPAAGHALLHRLILGLEPGDPRYGDHIDGNRLDYRRSNLRILTSAQSAQNVSGWVNSSSRHRGVSRNARRRQYEAYASRNGRKIHLGWFADEQAAAVSAAAWRAEHMPYSRDALEAAA